MKKKILRPAGHRVLLRLDPEKKKSDSKIVLLDKTKERDVLSSGVGTVVEIGLTAFQGYAQGQAWFNVGDRVHYVKHVGTVPEFEDDEGCKYRVVNEVDIFAFEDEVEIDE